MRLPIQKYRQVSFLKIQACFGRFLAFDESQEVLRRQFPVSELCGRGGHIAHSAWCVFVVSEFTHMAYGISVGGEMWDCSGGLEGTPLLGKWKMLLLEGIKVSHGTCYLQNLLANYLTISSR